MRNIYFVALTLPFLLLLGFPQGSSLVYLDQLDLRNATTGLGQVRAGRSGIGTDLKLGGKVYSHGIGTHARSEIHVRLNGKAEWFQATVGLDDAATGGSVDFVLLGDGKPLIKVPSRKAGGAEIEVSVKGVQVLTLVVDDAGNGNKNDLADWCDAQVTLTDPTYKPEVIPASAVETPAAKFAPTLDQFLPDRMAQDVLRGYLSAVTRRGETVDYAADAATWRMLVLLYPNTDTDYFNLQRQRFHYRGSLTQAEISQVVARLREFPEFVRQRSAGNCRLVVDIKLIERPLTLGENGLALDRGAVRLTCQAPTERDTAAEDALYNKPKQYDSAIVIFNAGPVPQDLAGAGGGGADGTGAWVVFGNADSWKRTGTGHSSVIFHEWTHGLDGFFLSQGYALEELHHTYKFGLAPWKLEDDDFFAAIHQGALVHGADQAYGYSKSVWMSGTPLKPSKLPPVQLLRPLSGAQLPPDSVKLSWSPTRTHDGYLVSVCKTSDLENPVATFRTSESSLTLPDGALKPGDYQWYVQAVRGKTRGKRGDTFLLRVVEREQLEPMSIGVPYLSPSAVLGSGGMVSLSVAVQSPSTLARVDAVVAQAEGHEQSFPLLRRSPALTDPVWTGSLWLGRNPTPTAREVSLRVVAVDWAGRKLASAPVTVRQSQVVPPAMATDQGVKIKPNDPLPIPGLDGTITLQATVTDNEAPPDGRFWAEIPRLDGLIDYVAMVGRRWDEGDWRTGEVAPRRGIYRVPEGGARPLGIRYRFREADGQLTTKEVRPFPLIWHYASLPGGFEPRIPTKRQSAVSGTVFGAKGGKVLAYSQGWADLILNRELDGGPLVIGKKRFAKGIGTHSKSVIVISLPKGAKTLSGLVGVTPQKNGQGSIVAAISTEGQLLFRSGVLRANQEAQPFRVRVEGCSKVELWIGDGGDDGAYDHANWANLVIGY